MCVGTWVGERGGVGEGPPAVGDCGAAESGGRAGCGQGAVEQRERLSDCITQGTVASFLLVCVNFSVLCVCVCVCVCVQEKEAEVEKLQAKVCKHNHTSGGG